MHVDNVDLPSWQAQVRGELNGCNEHESQCAIRLQDESNGRFDQCPSASSFATN